MNLHCHAQVGIAPFLALAGQLEAGVLAHAQARIACSGHFDRTLDEVKAMEPRWRELVYTEEAGSVQIRTMALFANDQLAILRAAAERALAAARAGDRELTVMHLLLVSHLIADACGTPAHICDLALLDTLCQRPESFRFLNTHALLETVPADADLGTWQPDLWRGDADDIALHTVQAIAAARERTGWLLIPLLQAYYRADHAAAQALTATGVGNAARVFGSFIAQVLASAGWLHGALLSQAPRRHDLRTWVASACILDFCCNYRPMIDGTVVYDEPGRQRDRLVIGGRERPGICCMPLNTRAGAFPDSPAIPFAHGRCLGLIEYRINPKRRYRFTCLAGHNESVATGGHIRVGAFSAQGGCFISEPLEVGRPVAIDLPIQGPVLYLYAEDLDRVDQQLRYVAFADPVLEQVD
jgi:hypothetical protein